MGRMIPIMVNRVLSHFQPEMMTAEIESGGVSVRKVNADSMALSENVTGGPDFDLIFVNLARFDRHRAFVRIEGLMRLRSLGILFSMGRLQPPPGQNLRLRGQPSSLLIDIGLLINQSHVEV